MLSSHVTVTVKIIEKTIKQQLHNKSKDLYMYLCSSLNFSSVNVLSNSGPQDSYSVLPIFSLYVFSYPVKAAL